MTTTVNLKLFVTQQTGTERLTIRDSNVGAPDDDSVWLFAKLEKLYDDDRVIAASCWVTWDYWILYGTRGVKLRLLDVVRKWRRRQLRGTAQPVANAPTFVLR